MAYWGVEPTHLVDPLSFVGGSKGNSDAYIFVTGSLKIVLLTLHNVSIANDAKDWTTVAQIPDDLMPLQTEVLRIPVSQNMVLAQSNQNLVVWSSSDSYTGTGFAGIAIYVAQK